MNKSKIVFPLLIDKETIDAATNRIKSQSKTIYIEYDDKGEVKKKVSTSGIEPPIPTKAATGKRRPNIQGKLWCFKCEREEASENFTFITKTKQYARFCNACKKDNGLLQKIHRREQRGLTEYPLDKFLPNIKAKLTAEQVRWARAHFDAKTMTQAQMEKELKVSAFTVSGVVHRKLYKWVEDLPKGRLEITS